MRVSDMRRESSETRPSMTFDPAASPLERQQHVAQVIAELSADERPILLGPYRSEPGFEALYWLPFLRYLAGKVPNFAARASIVTRGGLAPLYTDVAHQGYDLFALRSVTEVRREALHDQHFRYKGQTIKQIEPTDWDDAVLSDAADALGLGSVYHVVHPALMYWALAPFWEEAMGLKYLHSLTSYQQLPALKVVGNLPPDYVAMKWYGRPTFPYPHPEVGEFVQHIVATVAKQVPVVILKTESEYDDHVDIPIIGENVHLLPEGIPPEENLKIQAAVLSNAKAFMGPYGGMAQLALRLGVPSVSFYTEFGATSHAHLALSSWLSKASKVPFIAISLQDAVMVQQALVGKVAGVGLQPVGVAA